MADRCMPSKALKVSKHRALGVFEDGFEVTSSDADHRKVILYK